jgi:hypothetical protein
VVRNARTFDARMVSMAVKTSSRRLMARADPSG